MGIGRRAAGLELRLIGRVRLLRPDGTEVTPKGRKAQGLLALLGTSPQYRRHRAWLQDKLWSDRPPEQGGASLRQELAGLRRSLGPDQACLLTESGWVGLDPARVRVRLDADPDEWELNGTPPEFAAGLDIADPEFEDWIRDQRATVAERLNASPPPAPVRLAAVPAAAAPKVSDPTLAESFEPAPSIAVLPLQVHAEGEDASFYASGLVIDVIGRLSRFRRLDVIAHASAVAAASFNLPPRELGRHLNVRYVTEGTLLLSGSRLRLSFDLIDASRSVVIWSQSFNRAFEDIFDVVDEIAIALAAGIMVEIDRQERARVRARDPRSLDAYELCLRGLDEMLRLDRPGCDLALDLFTRAADREYGYARALSGISRAHGFYWKYRWTEEREAAIERADRFAVQAVDADVSDPSANAALGWVALYRRNHYRSLEAYSRAMELNPSDADILAEYADALQHSGSAVAAIPLFQRAIRLNPQMSDIYKKDLSGTFFKAGQYEDAIQTIHGMRRPEIADLNLTASLALAGRDEAARAAAAAVRRARPGFSSDAWVTMIPDLNQDDTARFLEGLKRAGL